MSGHVKIGINAFGCDHGRSGFGAYLKSFVKSIDDPGRATIEVFGPEIDRYTYASDVVQYAGVQVADSASAEKRWHALSFAAFAKKRGYDAVLFPAGAAFLPVASDVPAVVVIQSVFAEKKGDGAPLMSMLTRQQLKRTARIIATSNFVRDNLVSLSIPETLISVVYNGIDFDLFCPRDVGDSGSVLIHPFSIRRPYIIYASRISYPAKCHVQLIQGFSSFKEKTNAPHRLVLAGADGPGADEVHKAVFASPYSSDILLTGHFPQESLPELYSAADACVFPSKTEGVGFPVLEAFACGIPVACANCGALPEIAQDAAVFFNPDEPAEIAAAIERIVRLSSCANEDFRNELVKKAEERVAKYTWERCAIETLQIALEAALRAL